MDCGCEKLCGDLDEQDDSPDAVCKGLPQPPLPTGEPPPRGAEEEIFPADNQ